MKKYRLTAFTSSDKAVVTTNDEEYFNRLLSEGGEMIAHPGMANHQQDSKFCSCQSDLLIPFVVEIPLDRLARHRPVPTGTHGGYEFQVYD